MGTVISLPLSGFLADFLGWEWVFYVQGGLSMIWCILWIFLVYDSPEDHPRISQHESELFNQGLKNGAREGHKVSYYSLCFPCYLINVFCTLMIAGVTSSLEGPSCVSPVLGYCSSPHLQ